MARARGEARGGRWRWPRLRTICRSICASPPGKKSSSLATVDPRGCSSASSRKRIGSTTAWSIIPSFFATSRRQGWRYVKAWASDLRISRISRHESDPGKRFRRGRLGRSREAAGCQSPSTESRGGVSRRRDGLGGAPRSAPRADRRGTAPRKRRRATPRYRSRPSRSRWCRRCSRLPGERKPGPREG